MLNKKFLVTAGPTYEKIDPVRFIGNYSSGKMGFAIAEVLANNGAYVILVAGPVNITSYHKNIKVHYVETAMEMYEECVKCFSECDGAVMAAAVADYTPVAPEEDKIKRKKNKIILELKPTLDIASSLGKMKRDDQILVGFALEKSDELKNAKNKLIKKNFNFIVLNSINDAGAGFSVDTNKITIIDQYNNQQAFKLKHKREVAADIVEKIISLIS